MRTSLSFICLPLCQSTQHRAATHPGREPFPPGETSVWVRNPVCLRPRGRCSCIAILPLLHSFHTCTPLRECAFVPATRWLVVSECPRRWTIIRWITGRIWMSWRTLSPWRRSTLREILCRRTRSTDGKSCSRCQACARSTPPSSASETPCTVHLTASVFT